MPKTPVIIKIPGPLWDELGLDDPDLYMRALCALYIGRGPEYLRELVTRNPSDSEVTELLRTAPLLGLKQSDRLERK